jgi:hypothetical protein
MAELKVKQAFQHVPSEGHAHSDTALQARTYEGV